MSDFPNEFHPLIREWFVGRFGKPTEPQRLGWPEIAAGRNVLIAAPTGSGKTLAAFLVCLDRLLRQWVNGTLADGIQVVYVSPLKALSNDIERNLQTPLAEIGRLAAAAGLGQPAIRVAVRTGDTPSAKRQQMLRTPPHIVVTTPESLYLMLTSEKPRQLLRSVNTVIVDEIHALARDKRGSHLTLSLERLAALCPQPPVRIGLSATQKPIEEIGAFLVGAADERLDQSSGQTLLRFPNTTPDSQDVAIIDAGHVRDLNLGVEVPPSDLAAVCSLEQWGEVYERLVELITSHRSTLVFVNTRRMAERVAFRLTEMLGEEAVASHHGSLSKETRLNAEQRLKDGKLKAIVATASLEMGIDIGYIDLVCQIGSPRAIATFLQRVGRSGHSLKATPKGRLFPLTRDELLECMALIRAVRERDLDRIEIPIAPLDILAQQIVATVACEDWDEQALFDLFCRAWPYRNLVRTEFDNVLKLLSDGITATSKRGAYLHRDQIHNRLHARRHARIAAVTSGGAIPETAEYNVVTDGERTFVGKVDEDFAIESMAGDVFLLGNTSWRIMAVRGGEVIVRDAGGSPPTIPFWFGEAPGRTVELSAAISRLRQEIATHCAADTSAKETALVPLDLQRDCGVNEFAAGQAVKYVAAQVAALGVVPTKEEIVFERFFDESGGMQLVIHSPFGSRINRAWGLAMRKRFCRSFDFELQAAATDNGIVLSIGPQHSFPIEQLFKMLTAQNGQDLLQQALLAVPMFQVRWRWNVTRSLAVLRSQSGKKVPFFLQRFRSDDLLATAFPETVGCLENHHGDIVIPDHPLVRQTMHDCLREAMDLDRWLAVLSDYQTGKIKFVPCDTREPSPFSHELLNANPYAFLDGAPLEERRTRAVTTRRSLNPDDFRELTQLDPTAIAQVRAEAWPVVRDAEELHDTLLNMVVLPVSEGAEWTAWFDELVHAGRAARVSTAAVDFWIAAERWPLVRAVYKNATCFPPVQLPTALEKEWNSSDGWMEIVRGRMQFIGPVLLSKLAHDIAIDDGHVASALEALEGQGLVLRGNFSAPCATACSQAEVTEKKTEWCDRRLLARIHRLTLDGLRRQIQPVPVADFVQFLIRHQRLEAGQQWTGALGVREALGQLQGFEMPAGAWEAPVLAARIADYDPHWLDELFLGGEAMWGRLRPPRRDESDGPSMAAMTRVVPISLVLREDLPWLLPEDRANVTPFARGNAQQVLEALQARGALFFTELKLLANLLPAHLEEALRELSALGLITSDAFAAVRKIVEEEKKTNGRLRKWLKRSPSLAAPAGRWSLFPGASIGPVADRPRRWCELLLRRYGVLFRDLAVRETAAPSWFELVTTLRRMELRGEVRGGRFINGVSGEQFATEAAIGKLRQIRDQQDTASSVTSNNDWLVLSAADPLNVSGILDDGPRIPATHKNALILRAGRCVAAKRGGQIEFFDPQLDDATQQEMRRALQTGRRQPAELHIRSRHARVL